MRALVYAACAAFVLSLAALFLPRAKKPLPGAKNARARLARLADRRFHGRRRAALRAGTACLRALGRSCVSAGRVFRPAAVGVRGAGGGGLLPDGRKAPGLARRVRMAFARRRRRCGVLLFRSDGMRSVFAGAGFQGRAALPGDSRMRVRCLFFSRSRSIKSGRSSSISRSGRRLCCCSSS